MAADKNKTDARVVDGTLVASFMGAEPPKVWRADMKNLATVALELQQKDSQYLLIMKNGGNAETIAHFNDRDAGTDALVALNDAMTGPVITTATAAAAPAGGGAFGRFFKKLLKLVLWLVGIVVVIVIVTSLISPLLPRIIGIGGDAGMRVNPVKTGAPVSADELFGE